MSTHTQVTLKDPFTGKNVKIDAAIVNLIKVLWACGIQTSMSCQDTQGQCWLEVPTEEAFNQVLHALLKIFGGYSFQTNNPDIVVTVRYAPAITFTNVEGGLKEGYQIMFDKNYIEMVTAQLKGFLIEK